MEKTMPIVTKSMSVSDDIPFEDGSLEFGRSQEHVLFEQILELTWGMLENVTVDCTARRLILTEQQHLTIDQTAAHIVSTVKPGQGVTNERVADEIVGWLEMNHIPDGLTVDQFEAYEQQVTAWISEFRNNRHR